MRTNDGRSPLHAAAENGSMVVAKLLIDKKPELLNMRGNDGWSPLGIAKHNNQQAFCKWISNLGGV